MEREAQVEELIRLLKQYIRQEGKHFHEYSEECFIQDFVYFLGLSFDREKYSWHNGMADFIKKMDKALQPYRNGTSKRDFKEKNTEVESNEHIALKLYDFVKFYIPRGWKETIHTAAFVPMFQATEINLIREQALANKLPYPVYINDAIKEFFKAKKA